MKIKCIAVSESEENNFTDPWLTLGKEYIVLCIEKNEQMEQYYRIFTRNDGGFGSLGLFPSSAFEVTDSTWPPTWVEERVDGCISIAPKAWQRLGFWEDFYDGDRQAEDVFRTERDRILEHES